jgi:ADP-ribose pyrophosphatase YjhB (NUDIX family)
MQSLNFFFKEGTIKKKLKPFDSPLRISLRDDCFIKSAILFLIIPYEDKPYDLVLIRRSHRSNDKYAGEMSFPGGLYDPQFDNTFEDTALRETEEELGIRREKINLMGCVDDVITPKGHIITPFVGYVDKRQVMVKRDQEVQEIVKVPISFLVNKKNYRERSYKLNDDIIAVGRFNYKSNNKKYPIFGATSHIIVNFIELVYNLKLMKPGARRLNCEDLKVRDLKILEKKSSN